MGGPGGMSRCTHTALPGSMNPWWSVDLGELNTITHVRVLNRAYELRMYSRSLCQLDESCCAMLSFDNEDYYANSSVLLQLHDILLN